MSKASFAQYTVDYISGAMSLRKPLTTSLKCLESILQDVELKKTNNFDEKLKKVNQLYPTCTSFERQFMSLTFALATGVGKTRLMGAFIAYLYTQKNIRNFFVVAPNTTIYEKLINDLGNPNNPKYVFKGLGCFAHTPSIVTGEQYLDKSIVDDDINIYVFNIDKFNKENSKMRSISERFGDSFFNKLASLDDLVVIMDESHHYRAEQGAAALDELNPVMGLELTATPVVMKGTKPILFKNVVYEYPLSKAIADGYTRTPYALARADLEAYNFGNEQIDKIMLLDGINRHENYKKQLAVYAQNHNKPVVKPFALVVCKDTEHANWVVDYIKSDEFFAGNYKDKTIVVHSKQRGAEAEANLRALLSVERHDNPVEIVVHVDKLKEGWDVSNLFTIIPLRTAASKVLREQMVGRGLRLPYGERTGDPEIDSVTLTAHDKFKDILDEAQKGDSIFKAGNIIKISESVEQLKTSNAQVVLIQDSNKDLEEAYEKTGIKQSSTADKLLNEINKRTVTEVSNSINQNGIAKLTKETKETIVQQVFNKVNEDKDLAEIYKENKNSLFDWIETKVEQVMQVAFDKFIPIPKIKITDNGMEECCFIEFELDLEGFKHVPSQDNIIIQNLKDRADRKYIIGTHLNFADFKPEKELLAELRKKPEIDYELYSELIQKLIKTVTKHYANQYKIDGMKNIIIMNKKDIAQKIYSQMMQHFYVGSGLLTEEVVDLTSRNIATVYSYDKELDLYESFEPSEIRKILFTGIKYGVFDRVKFDSKPERDFAIILEYEASAGNIINWLKPAAQEFNLTYNRGKHYQPDFVVETKDTIYLVEIKGEDKLNDPDVIAKKDRSIKYCRTVSNWSNENGYKPWKHLFIPAAKIQATTSFAQLSNLFCVDKLSTEQ